MKRRYIWLVLGFVWLLVIWSNSMQTAAESSQTSLGILSWFMPLLAQTGIPEEFWHTLIRKLAHMTEFAVLGMLWCGGLSVQGQKERRTRWLRRLWAFLVCVGAACVDELIQRFVPGRSGELRDVCIDFIGGALGILVVTFAAYAIKVLRRRNEAHV